MAVLRKTSGSWIVDSKPPTTATASVVGPSGIWRGCLPFILFGVLWVDLIRQLGYVWETNEQYAYGWFVPIFALGLFWKRWIGRPPGSAPRRSGPLGGSLVFLSAAAILPLRVVYEINPDWSIFAWPLALIVVGFSMYAVYLAGGFPWVRHFAFPLCFILVAVPWPDLLERPLTQGLMRLNAGLTIELLSWFGIPAVQHGNLIELTTGTVGIDEACSGIRSLQSTLMGALLLGELYLFRWPWRLTLLASGLLLAFVFNVARTFFLSWESASSGSNALNKWHDPAGFTIAVACFFVLWLMALLARKRATSGTPPAVPGSGLANASEPQSYDPAGRSLSFGTSRRFLLAVGVWSLCVVGFTKGWYFIHERSAPSPVQWSILLPTNNPAFKEVLLSPRVVQMLNYDFGASGSWTEPDASQWSVHFFRWLPRSLRAVMSARQHHPETCLPRAGFQRVSDSGLEVVESGGLRLPFYKSTFVAQDQVLYVFFCIWQDGDEQRPGVRTRNRTELLRAALEGRRRVGQRSIEIIVSGYPDMGTAADAVRRRLPELIRVEGKVPSAISFKNKSQP